MGEIEGITPREAQPKTQMRILAVDDEPHLPKIFGRMARISKMAEKIGVFDVVRNGREALKKLKEKPGDYNIVLSDLQMPEMNGLQVAEKLKDEPVSVYLVTGAADTISQEEMQRLRIQGILEKPYTLENVNDFLERISKDLQKGEKNDIL